MADDIRLIRILPPQTIQGVQQPPITPQTGSGAPGTLSSINPGTILSGFIINRDAQGNPILRTDTGDIAFASDFFFKIGSEVVIRVQYQAGNTLARILSVNGQSPEIAATISSFSGEPEVIVGGHLRSGGDTAKDISGPPTTAAVRTSQSPQIVVTGTFIAPAAGTAQATPAAEIGTQLGLKVIALTSGDTSPPAAIPLAASTPPLPTISYAAYTKLGNAFPTPATTTESAAQPVPAPTAAIAISGETIAPTPVAAPNLLPQPLQIGQSIAGHVLSHDVGGESLVQTPLGLIRLDTAGILPHGSQVELEITHIVTPQALQAAATAAGQIPASFTQLATQWPSLQNIFTLLLGRGNAASDANLPQPQLPGLLQQHFAVSAQAPDQGNTAHAMISGLALFVQALRGGDIRGWLGRPNARWLDDNGYSNLLKKAESEFMTIARQFTSPPPDGGWQVLLYPLAAFGELHQVRMFVKRERKSKENAPRTKKDDDTRFIVEVDVSQMGEIQIDGFVRRREAQVEFDMIIRSHIALTPLIQQDMLQIYTRMGELTGYHGHLSFQNVREFPVHPMEEIAIDHVSAILV